MAALQPFVGTWSCVGGAPGEKPVNATVTYVAESGVLRQCITMGSQGEVRGAFAGAFSDDEQKHRYTYAWTDNHGGWGVSVAKPWSGNTISWTDLSSDDGKLGRSQDAWTGKDDFVYTRYDTATSATPSFKASCKRSS